MAWSGSLCVAYVSNTRECCKSKCVMPERGELGTRPVGYRMKASYLQTIMVPDFPDLPKQYKFSWMLTWRQADDRVWHSIVIGTRLSVFVL